MESMGYEKAGRITLIGFVIFSLLVIWVVNSYFTKEKEFLQREVDMEMTKSVLLDTYSTNQVLNDMHESMITQREYIKHILSNKAQSIEGDLPALTYLNNENVSILDESKVYDQSEVGNIILYGDWAYLDSNIKTEINQMSNLFELEKILNKQINFEMNSIYYSKNKYVTFYPYVEIGKRKVDYKQIFTNVDELIDKIQELDQNDLNFNPEEGWDRATVENNSTKKVTLSTAMPIIINNEIQGILTGSINESSYSERLNKDIKNTDVFITDSNNAVIYTNNKNFENLSDINDVFLNQYKIKYYQNKFPTQLEIRREKEYTLYITKLAKEKWYMIYVVDNMNNTAVFRLFIMNLIMFTMLFGIIYYAIRFDSIKRVNLESIIKNAKNDSMTELLNHKHIMDTLKKFVKHKRIRQLAIMMLDLDDFKVINDTYGHAVGDQVIQNCANVLKAQMNNDNSIAGRYGGEEFLFVSLRTTKEEALELAERIRVSISEMIYDKMGLNVTVSIGVYHVVKPNQLNVVELVHEADKYLYEAKKAGKNKVIGGSNI